MQTNVPTLPALYLSEAEAFALLDMCLMSSAELDHEKEAAIQKLTGLVRWYVGNAAIAETSMECSEEEETIPMSKVLACIEANQNENTNRQVQSAMQDHSGRICFRQLTQHY